MGPMVGNFIFWNGWKMECVFGQAVWKDILKLTLAKTYETEVNLQFENTFENSQIAQIQSPPK